MWGGKNIGNHTIYWATHVDPECIHTFEPNKHTFNILSKNIALNGLMSKVVLHNCAVGESVSACNSIVRVSDNSGENQVIISEDGEIPVVSIDSLQLKKIDFIKIDVEGFEYYVIKGAQNSIQKYKPIILVEIFDDHFEKVDKLLRSYGYIQKEYELLKKRHDYLYVFQTKEGI